MGKLNLFCSSSIAFDSNFSVQLNAPRPPRDGGNGGSGGFQQPSEGFAQIPEGSGGFGADNGFGDDTGGGNWADSVNNVADAAANNLGGGGGSGGDSW